MLTETGGRADAGQRPTGRLLRRLPWSGFRRLGWGVVDQGISSLTNFAVAVAVARMLGADHFGAFALAYVTYAFALNASRGLATDPLMARYGGSAVATWRSVVPACTGTALVVGLTSGAAVLIGAVFVRGPAQGAFLALGLMLPGLLVQDSWRYAFFALGRGEHACLNDLAWACLLVPGLFVAASTGHRTVFWFVLVWGAAASVAAGVGMLQARMIPSPRSLRWWVRDTRHLGLRYVAEGTSASLSAQLRTYAVGGALGLAAVGYVQAANTLMGPFIVILAGTTAVIVPEISRVVRRSPRHLSLACLTFGGSLVAIGLVWGLILLVALPKGLGQLLLGDIWRPAYPLVPLAALREMGVGAQFGAAAGLHALQAASRSVRAMLISSSLHLVLGAGGAILGGLTGTMAGTAVAAWLGAALWWRELRAARLVSPRSVTRAEDAAGVTAST